MENIACIILAAGKSTRMKSSIPKVLHQLCGRPVFAYVLDLVRDLRIARVTAVLGYKHELVQKIVDAKINIVIQKKLLGTADAVKQALLKLKDFKGTILVLYADNPLLTKETIKNLLKHHVENKLDATLLTAEVEKPAGYGRILRDKYFSISGIIEEKDADDFQKEIKEINTGIMCFNKDRLVSALKRVSPDNRKREYYLTDVIGIIHKNGGLVDNIRVGDLNEALGINSRLDFAKVYKIMQQKINEKLMKAGVAIIDPQTTFISCDAKIGSDTAIYPFTVIERGVKIGKNCSIGPFVHLREGTSIGNDAVAGNFLEIARSTLSAKVIAKHFCYLGDSRIGDSVNIGAGTVTANFDGKNKNVTVIKDKAFIGSDTVLVAPVKIGKGAKTAAGSVVLRNQDVADNVVVAGVPAKPLRRKT